MIDCLRTFTGKFNRLADVRATRALYSDKTHTMRGRLWKALKEEVDAEGGSSKRRRRRVYDRSTAAANRAIRRAFCDNTLLRHIVGWSRHAAATARHGPSNSPTRSSRSSSRSWSRP